MDQRSSQHSTPTNTSIGVPRRDLHAPSSPAGFQSTSSTQAQNGSVYNIDTSANSSSFYNHQELHPYSRQPLNYASTEQTQRRYNTSQPCTGYYNPDVSSPTNYFSQPHILEQRSSWEPWPGNSPLLVHNPLITNPADIEAARITRTKKELERILPHLPLGR